jgi:uncharacterized protein (DUF302 family)
MAKRLEDSAFEVRLDVPYPQALEKVTAALKGQGFGVLTHIDVQSTFKHKLNVDFRPYAILGTCNPPLAHQALTTDLAMGLLLPCTVVVYQDGDGSVVLILDPAAMLDMVQNPALGPVAREAHERLQLVAEALRAGAAGA